jgi:hypothetical protein
MDIKRRKWLDQKREAGYCHRCYAVKPLEGYKLCDRCRALANKQSKEGRAARVAQGLCGDCAQPIVTEEVTRRVTSSVTPTKPERCESCEMANNSNL